MEHPKLTSFECYRNGMNPVDTDLAFVLLTEVSHNIS